MEKEIAHILDVIKKAKEESGMTWREIAAKCGVSYGTISYWNTGRFTRPRLDT